MIIVCRVHLLQSLDVLEERLAVEEGAAHRQSFLGSAVVGRAWRRYDRDPLAVEDFHSVEYERGVPAEPASSARVRWRVLDWSSWQHRRAARAIKHSLHWSSSQVRLLREPKVQAACSSPPSASPRRVSSATSSSPGLAHGSDAFSRAATQLDLLPRRASQPHHPPPRLQLRPLGAPRHSPDAIDLSPCERPSPLRCHPVREVVHVELNTLSVVHRVALERAGRVEEKNTPRRP